MDNHHPTATRENATTTELVLCIFLGCFGIHKFYRKKIGMGILYLFTFGLLGFGWMCDTILIGVRLLKQLGANDAPASAATPLEPVINPRPAAPVAPAAPVRPVTTPNAKADNPKVQTHRVAGVTFYADNILALAEENPDYDMTKRELIDEGLVDERVWKYLFIPHQTELVFEPDNPKDPNAIKVVVDGEHVGYIKSGSTARVKNLMKSDRIKDIQCEIGGGPYKRVSFEYDENTFDEKYILDKDEINFFVHLEITEK